MDITALPYFTPLAKDYSARFETSPIHNFFAIAPNTPHEQMREIIDARLLRERALAEGHRSTVVNSVRRLHESLGPVSGEAARNLDLLEDRETLCVVTGQQAGILGGPLYTFYKAFTAVELAKSIREQFPSFHFVPIFWIETEDHDLEEIAQANVLNADGGLESIRYTPSEFDETRKAQWRKQAGPLPIEESSIGQFLEDFRSALTPTEFSDEIFEFLHQAYVPGRSLAHAFAAMLIHYFSQDGLLVIDANSRELKSLTLEVFRREIETSPQLSDGIVLQSERLEETYHAQVKPRALNLFYVNEDGERLPIVEREKATERSFFLKGSRKTFTLTELLAELDARPERFSPNVVMRPLYQDSLLPTVAYVAGPGEVAYFAQFQPAYEWAGLPMPLIHPRVTATLIEERLERILKKFRITAEDILTRMIGQPDGHGQSTALFDAMIASDLAPQFAAALENVDGVLESLRDAVQRVEPTLDGALTGLKGKVLTAMRDFEHKTLAAERKRHATTKAQLDKLMSALLPAGELQERELSLIYFLNRYGPNFLERLKALLRPIAIDFREHHIIHLSAELPVSNDGETNARTSHASERLSAPAI